MRGNWRFAAARLRNSGKYAIIAVEMLWFLGDSVDSRHERMELLRKVLSGFWGIVWTAGQPMELALWQHWLRFLGDSVDSRRAQKFWGIVWTTG